MPKRPSFQFYPSDWLRDTALRSCSTGARGLWMDMLCYMHEGNPYGHLKVGEKVILPANLARMVGETLDTVEGWLAELNHAGVYDLTTDGVIVSRRMIRDENLRNIRASGGKLGGNPTLMVKDKVGDKVNLKDNVKVIKEDNQNPTPSSSSSSSNIKAVARARPDDIDEKIWKDFLALRKAKSAPLTETALEGIRAQAKKADLSINQALQICCARGWQGFEAKWVKDEDRKAVEVYRPGFFMGRKLAGGDDA